MSRSFAFCIAELRPPLREWVGLTYLLCRILDTWEDTPGLTTEERLEGFAYFMRELQGARAGLGPEPSPESGLQAKLLARLSIGERELILATGPLAADLGNLPEPVRDVVFELIACMERGMQHFARHPIRSDEDLNSYCFFVAGIVGETLARLLALVEPGTPVTDSRLYQAHHFGLFLQKINVLKDEITDRAEGRHFVIDRGRLQQTLSENLHHAIFYVESLPLRQREFRLFCLWSLSLGLASLEWMAKTSAPAASRRLPRWRAVALIEEARRIVNSPRELREFLGHLQDRAGLKRVEGDPRPVVSEGAPFVGWALAKLYPRPLKLSHLRGLGLVGVSGYGG